MPATGSVVGIDLGLKDLAITSDGEKFDNPHTYAKNQKKLARLQRQLSRKTKGSHNREKAKLRVARLHEKIANQRNDALHKMTTKLVRENDVICMENLSVKNLVKNRKLAKSIMDASWGEVRRQLAYKTVWYGKELVIVDKFFPSSQICHAAEQRILLQRTLISGIGFARIVGLPMTAISTPQRTFSRKASVK